MKLHALLHQILHVEVSVTSLPTHNVTCTLILHAKDRLIMSQSAIIIIMKENVKGCDTDDTGDNDEVRVRDVHRAQLPGI